MLEIEKGYESVNKTFRIPVNIVEQLERLAERTTHPLIRSLCSVCNMLLTISARIPPMMIRNNFLIFDRTAGCGFIFRLMWVHHSHLPTIQYLRYRNSDIHKCG